MEQLKQKIIKAVPGIENYYRSGSLKVYDEKFNEADGAFDKDITLEDVLVALGKIKPENNGYYVFDITNSVIAEMVGEFNESPEIVKCKSWQLGKPLSEQTKETIEFLNKIID